MYSRLPRRRPRAALYGADYPSSLCAGSWALIPAVQRRYVSDHLGVAPYRVLGGSVSWDEFPAHLGCGDGFVRRYAARVQAIAQLLVQVRSAPALTRGARAAVTVALSRSFKKPGRGLKDG